MEKAFAKAEEMADNVKEYINTRLESVKLKAVEKTSRLAANIIAGIVLAVVFFFFAIFGGIALSLGLGEWLGKVWAGFLIVAFLYLLFGVLAWVARGKLIRLPMINALIEQFFNDDEED